MNEAFLIHTLKNVISLNSTVGSIDTQRGLEVTGNAPGTSQFNYSSIIRYCHQHKKGHGLHPKLNVLGFTCIF